MYRHIKIQLRFLYRLMRIRFKMHRKLACLEVAGWLTRLAFKISPDFEKNMMRMRQSDDWY